MAVAAVADGSVSLLVVIVLLILVVVGQVVSGVVVGLNRVLLVLEATVLAVTNGVKARTDDDGRQIDDNKNDEESNNPLGINILFLLTVCWTEIEITVATTIRSITITEVRRGR